MIWILVVFGFVRNLPRLGKYLTCCTEQDNYQEDLSGTEHEKRLIKVQNGTTGGLLSGNGIGN